MCEQAEAVLKKEHHKSGNTGVLDLEHSSMNITQETSVVSE